MVKKILLNYTPDYDFLLFALLSFEPDYKLIWDINNITGLDFSRTDDYVSYNKKLSCDQSFSSFIYFDEPSCLSYQVLSNQSNEGLLLEELKGIDYFLIVRGEYTEDFNQNFQTQLQKVKSIQNVFILEPEKLKGKERLLSE